MKSTIHYRKTKNMLHIQTEGAYDTIKWNKAYTSGIRKAPRLVINTYLGALLGCLLTATFIFDICAYHFLQLLCFLQGKNFRTNRLSKSTKSPICNNKKNNQPDT